MNKQEATQRIAQLLAQNESNIAEAVALADTHDITVSFRAPNDTHMSYVPQNGKRPTLDDYWENGYGEPGEDGLADDWDYSYAGWQNSSTFC